MRKIKYNHRPGEHPLDMTISHEEYMDFIAEEIQGVNNDPDREVYFDSFGRLEFVYEKCREYYLENKKLTEFKDNITEQLKNIPRYDMVNGKESRILYGTKVVNSSKGESRELYVKFDDLRELIKLAGE